MQVLAALGGEEEAPQPPILECVGGYATIQKVLNYSYPADAKAKGHQVHSLTTKLIMAEMRSFLGSVDRNGAGDRNLCKEV